MTTFAEPGRLAFEQGDLLADVAPTTLARPEVAALVDEMAGLAHGLFALLANALGGSPDQSQSESQGVGYAPTATPAHPVEPHPAGPVDLPAAPVLRAVPMPVDDVTAAAVPPAAVPMPEPVAEAVGIPMPSVAVPPAPVPPAATSVPMPSTGPELASIPMPAPQVRANPALATALLDEISFLDD